ncbi:hypothetical protein [Mycolicibacter minnesotensis]
MEIHRAFGQFGLGENVVEADIVKGPLRELMCSGTDYLLARGIRAPIGRISQRAISASLMTDNHSPPGQRYQSTDGVDSFHNWKSASAHESQFGSAGSHSHPPGAGTPHTTAIRHPAPTRSPMPSTPQLTGIANATN